MIYWIERFFDWLCAVPADVVSARERNRQIEKFKQYIEEEFDMTKIADVYLEATKIEGPDKSGKQLSNAEFRRAGATFKKLSIEKKLALVKYLLG